MQLTSNSVMVQSPSVVLVLTKIGHVGMGNQLHLVARLLRKDLPPPQLYNLRKRRS